MAGSRYGDNAEISGSLAVTGSAIFNEESKDVDFRIESDGESHMFFVDAANDAIGIATDSPNTSISLTVNGDAAFTDDKKLYFGSDGDAYIEYDEDGQDRLNIVGNDFAFFSTTSNKPKVSLFNYNTDAEGPLLIMQKWSQSSAADDDVCGDIQFIGLDDGNNSTMYARLKVSSADVTGGEEDGRMEINLIAAGSDTAVLRLESTQIGVFNSAPTEALDVIGNIRTVKNNNSAGSKAKYILAKSKGTAGSEAVVASGDTIGSLEYNAYDGDTFETAAEIYAKVDGTPGDGDMPGALYFATTADGAASTTDRMIIDSAGLVGIGTDPTTTLHVAAVDPRVRVDATAGNHPGFELSEAGTRKWVMYNDPDVNDNLTFKSDADVVVIHPDGLVGIGTTSPKVPLDVYEMGGLILGYTMLDNGGAAGNAAYTITTSYVVPTVNWKTIFKAPASGKVEIQFLGYLASAAAGNNYVYLGLSDNSTYNSLGSQYEKQIFEPDEDDNIMLPCSWYLTGLTPGTTYTYYVGTKGTATGHYWYYGGTNTGENPPIIIRAVSLPNTVTTD